MEKFYDSIDGDIVIKKFIKDFKFKEDAVFVEGFYEKNIEKNIIHFSPIIYLGIADFYFSEHYKYPEISIVGDVIGYIDSLSNLVFFTAYEGNMFSYNEYKERCKLLNKQPKPFRTAVVEFYKDNHLWGNIEY